jgi:phage baseplate assembly protein gpV
MSDLIATMRAIIREELSRHRGTELGIVTEVFARDSESGDNNHQVSIRLRSTGVELQRAPVVVGRAGFSLLPRSGDLVVVSYVDGDMNAPVVIGSIYDSESQPPVGNATETVYQPTEDQDSSTRRFYMELPSGAKLTIDDDTFHIESGKTEVIVARDGDVTVKSASKLTLQAQGDISIEASGNLNLSAQQNVTVKGMASTFEGQSGATVKGPSVTLAGMTQFSAS